MGTIYTRRKKQRDGTSKELPTLWIKYRQHGRTMRESTGTTNRIKARRILRSREGDVEHGITVDPKRNRITFDEAATDIVNDYEVNGRKSTDHVKSRLAQHLMPVFQGRRLSSITTTEVRAFVATREKAGASNGEVNRELAILKRMFTLARQAGKITDRPHVPMLQEDNARRGFFERSQYESVRGHLPEDIRPVVTFAYLTGWRVASEILPLQWRQVDFEAREVRLDPGTTKNREGRAFPFTAELETLLLELHQGHDRRKAAGQIVPWVFHRDGARIKNFRGAWVTATKAAGCPGRLIHDFRRTAVRNLERAGVSRSAAMAMVGHKTESIYRRYAIVDATVLREAAEKIDEAGGYTRQEPDVVGRGDRAIGA